MSKDDLLPNYAPSSAANLSLAVIQRLKAIPSFKMSLTEQLLTILLDSYNTRITVLELSRERIELENRRIRMFMYIMGVAMSLFTTVLGFLGISSITLPAP